MPETRLLVVGAGGHGRYVADTAELSFHFDAVGFLDDSLPVGDSRKGAPVLVPLASLSKHWAAADQAIVAMAG